MTANEADSPHNPGARVLTLGLLALCMSIGGFRVAYSARLMFDQNTQYRLNHRGEEYPGRRPWPEPWILAYTLSASCLMLAGSGGLLFRRRWGLTLAALAGVAWALSALGYLVTSYLILQKIAGPDTFSSLWRRPAWLVEVGVATIAIGVGVLFILLDSRPRSIGFPESRNRGLVRCTLVVWGLISIAASALFARWVFRLLE